MITSSEPEAAWQPPEAPKPKELSYKRKQFVQALANNPKLSPSQAVEQVYDVTTKNSAYVMASHLMKNKDVQLELAKYTGYAKTSLIRVLSEAEGRLDGATDKDVAPLLAVIEKTANTIVDRVDGKAQSNINVNVQSVNLNIDLSL